MPEHFEDPFENQKQEPEVSAETPLDDKFQNASLGKRFINVLIDGMVISGISSLLVFNTSNFFLANFVYFAYYIYMENSRGQTLGKMLTGTKVVTNEGEQPELSMIALRTLIRIIPIEWISFFLADDNTGWHDRWTQTRVVEI